jgi:flagellar motility protein MotE (MotC chaperone)
MAELSGIIAAVLSGVLVAALVFYVWGRRVEKRAIDQSQRLVLTAKEELMAVRENLHNSLDQKLAGVDRRDQDLHKLERQLEERSKGLGKREQEISTRLE